MQPLTIGAIALRPTGNVLGGFYFYNLSTGDIISRRSWTPLPMPKEVIDRVHKLAAADKFSRGTIYSEGEDIFEPAIHSTETAGVDVSFETAGVDVEFKNTENAEWIFQKISRRFWRRECRSGSPGRFWNKLGKCRH